MKAHWMAGFGSRRCILYADQRYGRRPRILSTANAKRPPSCASCDDAAQDGAVAQLGERLLCKQEVIGSIPFSSTRFWLPIPGPVAQFG